MNKHWFVVRTSSGVICYDSDVRTSFGEGHVCTGSCSLYHMDPPVLCLLISSALSVKKNSSYFIDKIEGLLGLWFYRHILSQGRIARSQNHTHADSYDSIAWSGPIDAKQDLGGHCPGRKRKVRDLSQGQSLGSSLKVAGLKCQLVMRPTWTRCFIPMGSFSLPGWVLSFLDI